MKHDIIDADGLMNGYRVEQKRRHKTGWIWPEEHKTLGEARADALYRSNDGRTCRITQITEVVIEVLK